MSAARRRRKAIERRQNVAYLFPQPGERPMSPFMRNLLGLGILERATAAQRQLLEEYNALRRMMERTERRAAERLGPFDRVAVEGYDKYGIPTGHHTTTCGCVFDGRALRIACPDHAPAVATSLAHFSLGPDGVVFARSGDRVSIGYDPARPLTPEDLTND